MNIGQLNALLVGTVVIIDGVSFTITQAHGMNRVDAVDPNGQHVILIRVVSRSIPWSVAGPCHSVPAGLKF